MAWFDVACPEERAGRHQSSLLLFPGCIFVAATRGSRLARGNVSGRRGPCSLFTGASRSRSSAVCIETVSFPREDSPLRAPSSLEMRRSRLNCMASSVGWFLKRWSALLPSSSLAVLTNGQGKGSPTWHDSDAVWL